MSTLSFHELTKRYGDVAALDGFTAVAMPGRVTAFVGPNGAGKTTALRILLGLAEPTTGAATIDGQRYRDLTHPTRVVGAVLDQGFHPNRTARNHLRIVARQAGVAPSRADELLHRFGLDEPARRRVGGYSLGMRQRLALASAVIGDPSVLILDEPLNGLDPDGIREMRRYLRSFADRGGTVLLSRPPAQRGRGRRGRPHRHQPGPARGGRVARRPRRRHRPRVGLPLDHPPHPHRTGGLVMNRLISLELHKLRTTPAAWVAIVITVLLGALSVATNTLGPITPGGPAFGSTDHVNHALSVSALTSMVMLSIGVIMVASEYRTDDRLDVPRDAAARSSPRRQAGDRPRARCRSRRGGLRARGSRRCSCTPRGACTRCPST